MAGTPARREAGKEKLGSGSGRIGRGQAKKKKKNRPARSITSKKTSPKQSGQKRPNMTQKKVARRAKPSHSRASARPEAETSKRVVIERPVSVPEPPPRLLRESKSMNAALAALEKGIKLLYQKDFKKARAEFKSLLDSYPQESEILARTRSYVLICDREETARRKAASSTGDLYALGVLEHNRGNYESAISTFRQALVQHPEAEYIYYSLATSLAMKGDAVEAIRMLGRSIELNEENRIYAKNDSDFSALHSNKDFTELVGLSLTTATELSQL